jgi:transcriptional regulator with PAS, ATPase and Fis domain
MAATTINNSYEMSQLTQQLERMRQENVRYQAELAELRESLSPFQHVIGRSPSMEELKQTISDYADSNLTILLTGETGVGKEVFARAIHQLSRRAQKSYVKINCAAIPANLLESELFGYADGAFSGAAKGGKPGKFELANGGTLLLDEIGEMPMDLQAKLLRVLQEKEFERVGGVKPMKLDVRVLCSTNEDLPRLIREGRFREDLYYRINVVELRIPPLRERREDIAPLCERFIDQANQENGYAITGLEPEALKLLERCPWPGNVRELEHAVQRAAVRAKAGMITTQHLDFLAPRTQNVSTQAVPQDISLRSRTEQAERESILQALEQAGGNKTKAAQLLGIDRSRLYSRLKKYGM